MSGTLFKLSHIPVFQNVLYETEQSAINAIRGSLDLQFHKLGYVFNAAFDGSLMDYNAQYHNEQTHSPHFVSHLEEVIGCLNLDELKPELIVEVGCGKGFF